MDEAQHQGRIRSFPHEKNNWASFIYVDVSDLDLDEIRNFLVTELEVEPTEDVHVSLSRTVSLRLVCSTGFLSTQTVSGILFFINCYDVL